MRRRKSFTILALVVAMGWKACGANPPTIVINFTRAIFKSCALNLLTRKDNWLSWPRGRLAGSFMYFVHSFLTSSGSRKSIRYASFGKTLGHSEKTRARGGGVSWLELEANERLAIIDDAIVDVDEAGLEIVDDAEVDDAVDTTPNGLDEADFDKSRVPTRFTVAPGGLNFAFDLPVLADDTSREVFDFGGVFVMIAKELLLRGRSCLCVDDVWEKKLRFVLFCVIVNHVWIK